MSTLARMMSGADVLSVLDLLREAGAEVVIAGGWGIDALVGEETREHRDLDLLHIRDGESAVIGALAAAGYRETLDRRPVRFVLTHPSGLEIDLHPLEFAADGSAVQSSPDPRSPSATRPSVSSPAPSGTTVRCISAEQQVRFHQGYEPADHDLQDMAQLRRKFGINTRF
ncbi:amino acid transporter [Streptomyces sp. M10(2022)]